METYHPPDPTSEQNSDKFVDEELENIADTYEPYIPIKKRKKQNDKNDIKIPQSTTIIDIIPQEQFTNNIDNPPIETLEETPSEKTQSKSEFTFSRQHSYTTPLTTSWKAPKFTQKWSSDLIESIRNKFNCIVEGNNIPPPLFTFKEMKLNRTIIEALKTKNILNPTAMQMQGLPVVLFGRDLIGISFTGSGKTLVFLIPILVFALEQELELPFKHKEGPFALIIVPSRELAKQIIDLLEFLCDALVLDAFPHIKLHLCVGGVAIRTQIEQLKKGCHIMVATPGRLTDLINKRAVDFSICRILCLDDADKMLDMGFEVELKKIFNHFKYQHQTLVFSSTTPKRLPEFASSMLVKPVTINISRCNVSNLNVIQEIELVSEETKYISLVKCTKKTPPPILIYSYRKSDVDNIYEYLKLKEMDALVIHGDKTYEERKAAIAEFQAGKVDIMITTDIASKTANFPVVKHVINYDMPNDINIYINRISRTGGDGRIGVSTTFIAKFCDEAILVDLRNLLIESNQKIPQFLMDLKFETDFTPLKYNKNCSICGSKGHLDSNHIKKHV